MYNDLILETIVLDIPNNLAVFVTDAPDKRTPTIYSLLKSEKSPILYFCSSPVGMPIEMSPDNSITRDGYRGYMQSKLAENIYKNTIWQWHLYQWALRLNRHLEMVCTLSPYTARFTTLSHCYTRMRKICQGKGNFTFSILLKQQQNDFEDQSNQVCIAKIMQQLDEMLQQVNPFAESYKQIHQMKHMKT
jgi:hypothetical protein